MLLVLFSIFIGLLVYIFVTYNKSHQHWKKKGVKHSKPIPFFGNILPIITGKESSADYITNIYKNFATERYCGTYQFTTPILIINDIELIKEITIKKFDHFSDHYGFRDGLDTLWSKTLFASEGERWHDLRQTMSPVFTSSKMRIMFELMNECAQRFVNYFQGQKDDIIQIEMKDVSSRFANDVIASAAFGITCDSLKNKDHEFLSAGRDLTNFTGINKFKFFINASSPWLGKLLGLKIVSDKVGSFFTSIISETLKVREEKKIVRQDLIHLLMMAREGKLKYEEVMGLDAGFATVQESDVGKKSNSPRFLSDEDITAQALIFFFGGYDTTSTGAAFVCYELTANLDIQNRLRDEIRETYKEGNGLLTYDKLAAMKYMDMVVSESLRKWTQAMWLDRKCTKDFVIKAERPGEHDLEIKAGDVCWVPVWAIHRDPQYFSNPDKFDPERFSNENKDKIQSGTYMPFGVGPRNCIGSRFALLEAKIFLFHLLINFELVPVEKTIFPIQVKKNSFILMAEGGVNIGLKRLIK